MHYLDHAATTLVLPEAVQAVTDAMQNTFGNPSSLHRMGIEAAHLLEDSRKAVAASLGAQPEEITFTSGATESTNTALRGVAHLHRHHGGRIITTSIEHAATLQTAKELSGFQLTLLQPDTQGHIAPDALAAALTDDTVLFSCQLVNNEIGTVQPVEALGAVLKARCPQALFHVDAVQGLFRVPITPRRWNCEMMSVSGHKVGSPKGIGALYVRQGVRLPPLLVGGGQERGQRSGTEALPAIAGFAAACRVHQARFAEEYAHVERLAEYLHEQLSQRIPDAAWNGTSDVPHVQNFSVPGCKSEVMLRVLESEEVYVSSGSACSKGKQSAVLRALGLPRERTDTALRVSFAPMNETADIDALIAAIEKGIRMLRR